MADLPAAWPENCQQGIGLPARKLSGHVSRSPFGCVSGGGMIFLFHRRGRHGSSASGSMCRGERLKASGGEQWRRTVEDNSGGMKKIAHKLHTSYLKLRVNYVRLAPNAVHEEKQITRFPLSKLHC